MSNRRRPNKYILPKDRRLRRKIIIRRRVIFFAVILIVLGLTAKAIAYEISKNYLQNYKEVVTNIDTNSNENNEDEKVNSPDNTSDINTSDEKEVEDTSDLSNNLDNEADFVEESSEKDYKEIYKKDMFFGDSITEGITFFEFLDEANVIAKPGINIWNADDEIKRAVQLQPENFYLLFGLNDIDNVLTSEKFSKLYGDLIHKIKHQMPNTKVYIQSILPVLPKASKRKASLTNKNVDDFNDALKDLAQREGVQYLNISEVLKGQDNAIYESDGIHFKEIFYNMWLDYIIENTKFND